MNKLDKVPMWFLVVAVLALVWNAMGVSAFISTVMISAEDFAKMPKVMQNLQNATPIWATAAFAIAVFAGTIGSLLLVLKKTLAFPVLLLSLIAVVIQMSNFIFLMNGFDYVEQAQKIMTIMIIVVAILLVILAKFAKAKGWLN